MSVDDCSFLEDFSQWPRDRSSLRLRVLRRCGSVSSQATRRAFAPKVIASRSFCAARLPAHNPRAAEDRSVGFDRWRHGFVIVNPFEASATRLIQLAGRDRIAAAAASRCPLARTNAW